VGLRLEVNHSLASWSRWSSRAPRRRAARRLRGWSGGMAKSCGSRRATLRRWGSVAAAPPSPRPPPGPAPAPPVGPQGQVLRNGRLEPGLEQVLFRARLQVGGRVQRPTAPPGPPSVGTGSRRTPPAHPSRRGCPLRYCWPIPCTPNTRDMPPPSYGRQRQQPRMDCRPASHTPTAGADHPSMAPSQAATAVSGACHPVAGHLALGQVRP